MATTKQVIRGSSLMGGGDCGAPTLVDVHDGVITRIRPLHYDMSYDPKDFNAWRLEVKGKVLEPPLRPPIGPISLAYKKRVYSKNRVKYPLKRVDWDPAGAPGSTGPGGRNTQNRGTSKYVRISWNEAAGIVAAELKRVGATYGPEAVLSQADMHGETKHLSPSHACANRLLSLLGGYTIQMRNLDSWEGWNWGAKHVWGCEPVGEMMPWANVFRDIAEHGELLLFWGCDPETTPHPIHGMFASNLAYWLTDVGLKSVYVCPDLNYGAAVHAREIETMKVKGPDGYLYEPVWINPAEAAARGIANGDIVKVFNERGVVLGGAYVTERVRPGVAYMDHGARWDPIVVGEIDRGGAINTITPHQIISKNCTGMVVSGFLVEVAKVTDDEMAGWRRDYPDAFSRDYDPATGVSLTGWLIA